MNERYKAIGSFATVGLEIALSILLGSGAGYWADSRLGTSPALVLLGFVFGCAAAVKAVLRAYREMQSIAAREEAEQGNPAPLFEKPEPKRDEADEDRPRVHPASSTEEGAEDGRA